MITKRLRVCTSTHSLPSQVCSSPARTLPNRVVYFVSCQAEDIRYFYRAIQDSFHLIPNLRDC